MPLLALFDAETAVAPRGMSLEKSQAQEPRNRRSFERRTKVDESLAPFAEVGEEWNVLLLGGRNYIAYEENEYTHMAKNRDEDVTVVLSGSVEKWPGGVETDLHEDTNDAEKILDLYLEVMGHDVIYDDSKLLEPLKKLQGSFAFVLFDRKGSGHVLASKDGNDTQTLHWGCTPEGGLLFGTERNLLDRCNPTATSFPNGVLFSSQGSLLATCPGSKGWSMLSGHPSGHLLSFERPDYGVKTIPRINSKGVLCGAVYRVSSSKNLDPTISA